MEKRKFKVYLADDHTFVRKGMTRLLKTFERVAEVKDAQNGKELIDLIKINLPDIVILDVEMPVMNGINTAKYINTHFESVKMLVLTMHTDAIIIHELLENGVHGFLNKDSDTLEVERALYDIIDNDFYVNNKVGRLLSTPHLPDSKRLSKPITPREREILMLICQDQRPSEIAARLQITQQTYFIHRDNLIRKINARTNVGLVKYAIKEGYYKL